jgi:hypothetical protein
MSGMRRDYKHATSIASGKELLVIVDKSNAQFFFPGDLITLRDSLKCIFT